MMVAVGLTKSPQSIKYQLGYLLLRETADEKLEHTKTILVAIRPVSQLQGVFSIKLGSHETKKNMDGSATK